MEISTCKNLNIKLIHKTFVPDAKAVLNYFSNNITVMSQERHVISHHQQLECLLNCLHRLTVRKTSKILCKRNSPVTSSFPHKEMIKQKVFLYHDVIMQLEKHSMMLINSIRCHVTLTIFQHFIRYAIRQRVQVILVSHSITGTISCPEFPGKKYVNNSIHHSLLKGIYVHTRPCMNPFINLS